MIMLEYSDRDTKELRKIFPNPPLKDESLVLFNTIKIFKNFDKSISKYLKFVEKGFRPIYLVYTNRKCDLINSKIRIIVLLGSITLHLLYHGIFQVKRSRFIKQTAI